MRICICGGGNLGHVCAGFLANRGHEVSILTTKPERWTSEIEIIAKNILTIPFSAIFNLSFNRPVYDTYSNYSHLTPAGLTKGTSIDAEATSSVNSSSKFNLDIMSTSTGSSSYSKDISGAKIMIIFEFPKQLLTFVAFRC